MGSLLRGTAPRSPIIALTRSESAAFFAIFPRPAGRRFRAMEQMEQVFSGGYTVCVGKIDRFPLGIPLKFPDIIYVKKYCSICSTETFDNDIE